MSTLRTTSPGFYCGLNCNAPALDTGADGELLDALSASLTASDVNGAGELLSALRTVPDAPVLLSEGATIIGMLALARALGKGGLERELLTFRSFSLSTSMVLKSSCNRGMGSVNSEQLYQMADRLFGDAMAVTPETAAKALDCSLSKIYGLIRDGELAGIRLSERKSAGVRVTVISLIEFIANGGVAKPSLPTPAAAMATRRPRRGTAAALL